MATTPTTPPTYANTFLLYIGDYTAGPKAEGLWAIRAFTFLVVGNAFVSSYFLEVLVPWSNVVWWFILVPRYSIRSIYCRSLVALSGWAMSEYRATCLSLSLLLISFPCSFYRRSPGACLAPIAIGVPCSCIAARCSLHRHAHYTRWSIVK